MNTINVIQESDQIVLNSVESYLRSVGTPVPASPQEKLFVMQQARDYLYSEIVHRLPRIAAYIIQNSGKDDNIAKGLFTAISKHSVDPVLIQVLMQYLSQRNNPEENGIVGALLAKVFEKLYDEKKVKPAPQVIDKKSDKDKSMPTKPEEPDISDIKHIGDAVNSLLGQLASIIATRCANITMGDAITVAALIVMDNEESLKEMINSDLPISAQVFDVVKDPSNIIRAALNLNKTDYAKLTTNQSNFVESLKKWVYDKLNIIPTQTSYQFIIAAYGSMKPDTSMKLIQLKDCGTQYSNLLAVAKQIVNN
jgi:hypothetical protein